MADDIVSYEPMVVRKLVSVKLDKNQIATEKEVVQVGVFSGTDNETVVDSHSAIDNDVEVDTDDIIKKELPNEG